jgi:hypothetical protein
LVPLTPLAPPEPIVTVYDTPSVTLNADSADAPPPEGSPVTDDLYPPAPPPPPNLFDAPFGVAPPPPPPATTRYSIAETTALTTPLVIEMPSPKLIPSPSVIAMIKFPENNSLVVAIKLPYTICI